MKKHRSIYRFLLAGGGTGGHIFPALAVAEVIRALKPEAEFLFIGTKDKIESTVVPKAGFNFKSIWIKGFARKLNFENIIFPLKVIVSMIQSLLISIRFKPTVTIGSGGYVSGPAVWGASVMGAKVILMEQNSYPGLTTRMLEKRANEIHVSFEDSRQYLREKGKIILTGNPVRTDLQIIDKQEALKKFNFNPSNKTLFILGGSLGARSVNQAAVQCLELFKENNIQLIWQTGKLYFEEYKNFRNNLVWINHFVDDMSSAFSSADLVVSRAGATTIAELSILGIPVIFIPSPNVAANHQYYNAKSLADADAAILLEDSKAKENLGRLVLDSINDANKLSALSENIKKFAKPDAGFCIAKSAIKWAESI